MTGIEVNRKMKNRMQKAKWFVAGYFAGFLIAFFAFLITMHYILEVCLR